MSHYTHITPEEREKILVLYSKGYSISYIAANIKRNKSTVSREFPQNRNKEGYSAVAAQAAYEKRRNNCRVNLSFLIRTFSGMCKKSF